VRGSPVVRSFDSRLQPNAHCVHCTVRILHRFYGGSIDLIGSNHVPPPNGHSCPSFECRPDTHVSVASSAAHGHSCILPYFCCSEQRPYLPTDTPVSFPLLNVAPSDSLIQPWTFRCPFHFRTLLPTTALSANGHFGVLPSLPVSTGFSFTHYHHRCQDFCSLHGFRLTLEERQCTQPRPCAQNLAPLGAGMVASGSGLTCHVIP
jgi:hypothetical protein